MRFGAAQARVRARVEKLETAAPARGARSAPGHKQRARRRQGARAPATTSAASTSSCSRPRTCGCPRGRRRGGGASSTARCGTRDPAYLGEVADLRAGAALAQRGPARRRGARQRLELLEVYDEQLARAAVADRRAAARARRRARAARARRLRAGHADGAAAGNRLSKRTLDMPEVEHSLREQADRASGAAIWRAAPPRPGRTSTTSTLVLDGQPARLYASQGQLRAIVLALKIAEIEFLRDKLGDSPILLLDDVSSELDPTRNAHLFEFLRIGAVPGLHHDDPPRACPACRRTSRFSGGCRRRFRADSRFTTAGASGATPYVPQQNERASKSLTRNTSATITTRTRSRSSRASKRCASGPGMYIGDTDDGTGLHHMVYEVVDNSVDEALAGHCTHVDVIIHYDNSVTVEDNGRGMPVDMHPTENRPAPEVIMTVLHAGGKFDHGSYKVSGGLHGVGVSVVNALSEWLKLEIRKNGKVYYQEYRRGDPSTEFKQTGVHRPALAGTKVTFKPDPEIFRITEFSLDTLAQRCASSRTSTAGCQIRIIDERSDEPARRLQVRRRRRLVRRGSQQRQGGGPRQVDPLQRRARRASRSRSRCSGTTPTPRTSSASPTTSRTRTAARTSPAFARR